MGEVSVWRTLRNLILCFADVGALLPPHRTRALGRLHSQARGSPRRVLSLPLAIAIADVRPIRFVVAGNEPATKCRPVIFGIAVAAAAVPFIGVAEFIVT